MANQETALVVRPQQAPEPFEPENLDQAFKLAEDVARAQIVPAHLRGSPHDAYVILLFGRELGLAPMQSMLNVDMVEGRPRLNAQMTVALVKRSPVCRYFRLVDSTDDVAVYETLRRDEPEPTRLSYTIAQAQKAGLVRPNSNWAKHPAAMLRHRCAMALARAVYPDVTGNLYDDDEIAEIRENAAREVMQAPPPPTLKKVSERPTIDVTSTSGPAPSRGTPPAPSETETKAVRPAPSRAAAKPTVPAREPTAAEDSQELEDFGRAAVGEPKPNSPEDVGFRQSAPAEEAYRPVDVVIAEMWQATRLRKTEGPEKARAAVDAAAAKIKGLKDVTAEERQAAIQELKACRDLIAGKIPDPDEQPAGGAQP